MAVIRPEWANEPGQYAPPDRRVPEDTVSRQQTAEHNAAGNLDSLIQRIAGASMDEIDAVIRELENIRENIRREAERVSFDVTAFASVSQSSMSAMKIISDSLKALKKGPNTGR